MVVVDTNVLLYAVNRRTAEHEASWSWMERSLRGAEGVGFSWIALLGFLRVGTHPAALDEPLSVPDAITQVERWLSAPAALIVQPTSRHATVLGALLREVGSGGNLVPDAHLAALAVEHDATVVSFDRDFARFEGVRHRLPG
jgi:toxin-antitoxin system PIN domain toxin